MKKLGGKKGTKFENELWTHGHGRDFLHAEKFRLEFLLHGVSQLLILFEVCFQKWCSVHHQKLPINSCKITETSKISITLLCQIIIPVINSKLINDFDCTLRTILLALNVFLYNIIGRLSVPWKDFFLVFTVLDKNISNIHPEIYYLKKNGVLTLPLTYKNYVTFYLLSFAIKITAVSDRFFHL